MSLTSIWLKRPPIIALRSNRLAHHRRRRNRRKQRLEVRSLPETPGLFSRFQRPYFLVSPLTRVATIPDIPGTPTVNTLSKFLYAPIYLNPFFIRTTSSPSPPTRNPRSPPVSENLQQLFSTATARHHPNPPPRQALYLSVPPHRRPCILYRRTGRRRAVEALLLRMGSVEGQVVGRAEERCSRGCLVRQGRL